MDLAFIIAPSCPSLLQRKLELKNIQFIQSDKRTDSSPRKTNEVTDNITSNQTNIEPEDLPSYGSFTEEYDEELDTPNDKTDIRTKDSSASKQPSESTYTPNWTFGTNVNAVNINKADKNSLIAAFRGTGVYKTTIDKLIKQRPFTDLDDLANKLRFTEAVRKRLKDKLDNNTIEFSNKN